MSWTPVNPLTGKREIVNLEGEFVPGETIVKLNCLQTARQVLIAAVPHFNVRLRA